MELSVIAAKKFTAGALCNHGGSFYAMVSMIAPFGLTMSPNISLISINRFSMSYGGEPAVAAYACIAYVICIVYLILQGVGDGSQPLLSQHYGEKNFDKLKKKSILIS